MRARKANALPSPDESNAEAKNKSRRGAAWGFGCSCRVAFLPRDPGTPPSLAHRRAELLPAARRLLHRPEQHARPDLPDEVAVQHQLRDAGAPLEVRGEDGRALEADPVVGEVELRDAARRDGLGEFGEGLLVSEPVPLQLQTPDRRVARQALPDSPRPAVAQVVVCEVELFQRRVALQRGAQLGSGGVCCTIFREVEQGQRGVHLQSPADVCASQIRQQIGA